jgi:salicylate hydroxylase
MDGGGRRILSQGRSDDEEAYGVMTRVAIIGGGIGGLAAANALSRAGIEVAVYEAAAELREIGAGVALHPNAMKVLRALSLEDKVRAVAGRSDWALSRNWKTGRIITRTSRQQQAASFGAQGTTAHRADLLDVLAGGLPDDVVTLGKRCQAVLSDGDVAVARFADGTAAEADIIVGADGIHSRVRESLFGPDAPRFTGKICYRSIVPAAAVPGAPPGTDVAQWLGPHGTIVLYPLRGTELINVVAHYDDAGYRHESWIAECDGAEVLERYAGWHESVLRLLSAAGTWYKWALYDRDPIPRWTRGRVTLLGDAAHAMLPYLGQGACQALEDSAVLATALAAEPGEPARGLARYERTRRPRASSVVLTARERGLSNHLTSPWAAWRRDLSIAVRRRLNQRDPEGRGAAWLAAYDATSPDVLVLRVQQAEQFSERRALARAERREQVLGGPSPGFAQFVAVRLAPLGEVQADRPAVRGIDLTANEPRLLQRVDHGRDRPRDDAELAGQLGHARRVPGPRDHAQRTLLPGGKAKRRQLRRLRFAKPSAKPLQQVSELDWVFIRHVSMLAEHHSY